MRVPVLFATNDKYVPYCRVSIASMLEHASPENEYIIYIFHKGLSRDSMEALTAFARENVRVEPREVGKYLHSAMREVKWYTQETYYRLMAANVLPEEDKIVYLDCDIVVLEDVAHLFAVDMGDALLGAVPTDPPSAQRMGEILGVPIGMVFNAGVLLCNLAEWRKIDLYSRSMEALERFKDKLRYQDQDALSIVCGERIIAIDPRWNNTTCPPNRAGVMERGICHMFSSLKPWNSAGDSNYALYYAWAKRVGVLPPAQTPRPFRPGERWARRRLGRLRPAILRGLALRAGGAAYSLATACVPGHRPFLRCVRFCVTARCPGKCAHCEQLCPERAALPEIDKEQLLSDLRRLFAATRFVRELRLTGGEPLARADIADIVRFALRSGHVQTVSIETPGFARPSRELRALLEDGLVRLCTHNAPAPEIISFREQDRVDTWPWADFGPLERRDCTDDELYWQVRACGADDWYYLDGRLWPCARMACAVALGRVPESACVFADLRGEKSRLRTARALEKLTQPRPMEACRYCLRGTVDFRAVPPEV